MSALYASRTWQEKRTKPATADKDEVDAERPSPAVLRAAPGNNGTNNRTKTRRLSDS